MEAYLTSKEIALADSQGGDFDLGTESIVRIDRPIEDPHRTKQIVYRARLKEGSIRDLLTDSGPQRVKPVDDQTVELTVRAIRPGEPGDLQTPQSDRPKPVDSQSTTMLQSDDAEVVRMARQVSPQETDAWRLACELERHVKGVVELKNYTTAMATAAEVARTREGDCTEHAMLLAALCRAREIPARVAIGLVYYPPVQGFAYHMWTEVWIEDRWVPLDATLGLGGIGACHLKLSHSSLQGSSAFAELLPVVQAIGRLELEIVSTE
jgi:transglutaminase-like putative cysteine protease